MDNDVIDLSSDDEMCPSPKKKAKTILPPPNIRLQSNKQLTIRTTRVINKPPAASPKPNNTIILAPAKSSDLRRGTQSILLSNNNLRPSLIQTKITSPGLVTTMGKQQPVSSTSSNPRFQKKITTGEITIVPINIKEPQRCESSSKLIVSSIKSDPKPSVIKPNCDLSKNAIAKPNQLIKPAKRIAPTKISDNFTFRANSLEKSSDSDMLSLDSSAANDEASTSSINQQNGIVTAPKDKEMAEPEKKRRKEEPETPLNPEMQSLIEACRVADKTDVMEALIQRLIKYYRKVHPKFISSQSFRERVEEAANQVKAHPSVVVVQLKDILEELKQRRSNDINIVQVDEDDKPTEVPSTTGNKAKDKKVVRLSQALFKLKNLITENEQAEVDWDDEINSNFLIMERYKKRACEIYTKICLLTGENTNAERLVKKPIRFRGTEYREFNRKLEKFVNETQAFPDRYDVKRILEYCNKEFDYCLNKDTMDIVATDAFVKIGNDLQKRRKTDLYEMVDYFTQNQSDPATQDPALRAKLDDNLKKHKKKMNDVIDKFTRQDQGEDVDGGASTSNNISGNDTNEISPNKKPAKTESTSLTSNKMEIIDDDDDDVLNVSDDVVLVQDDSNVEDFFGEISRNLNTVPSDDLTDTLFQIESVESLHPSLFGDGL